MDTNELNCDRPWEVLILITRMSAKDRRKLEKLWFYSDHGGHVMYCRTDSRKSAEQIQAQAAEMLESAICRILIVPSRLLIDSSVHIYKKQLSRRG